MCFKNGIQPAWEDEHNANGTKIIIFSDSLFCLKTYWQKIVGAAYNQHFGFLTKFLNGFICEQTAVQGKRISIWLSLSILRLSGKETHNKIRLILTDILKDNTFNFLLTKIKKK